VETIGHVRNQIRELIGEYGEREHDAIVSEIHIDPKYAEALEGLEGRGPYYVVLYLFHKVEETHLKAHPRGDVTRPKRGVFATRSQLRPTKIGVCTVELLGREGLILKVRGLDALDGSPVIDIKPYAERFDAPARFRDAGP